MTTKIITLGVEDLIEKFGREEFADEYDDEDGEWKEQIGRAHV